MELPNFEFEAPRSLMALEAVLKHQRIGAILSDVLSCLHHLQTDVLAKLESACDSSCDIPKRTYTAPTDDPELIKLVAQLNKPANQNRTQFDVALDITNGNEKDARTLLRKGHRRNILPQRRRKSDKARA